MLPDLARSELAKVELRLRPRETHSVIAQQNMHAHVHVGNGSIHKHRGKTRLCLASEPNVLKHRAGSMAFGARVAIRSPFTQDFVIQAQAIGPRPGHQIRLAARVDERGHAFSGRRKDNPRALVFRSRLELYPDLHSHFFDCPEPQDLSGQPVLPAPLAQYSFALPSPLEPIHARLVADAAAEPVNQVQRRPWLAEQPSEVSQLRTVPAVSGRRAPQLWIIALIGEDSRQAVPTCPEIASR